MMPSEIKLSAYTLATPMK